jgi:hypothetical protein
MSKSYSMKETDIGEERRNLRDPTVYIHGPCIKLSCIVNQE